MVTHLPRPSRLDPSRSSCGERGWRVHAGGVGAPAPAENSDGRMDQRLAASPPCVHTQRDRFCPLASLSLARTSTVRPLTSGACPRLAGGASIYFRTRPPSPLSDRIACFGLSIATISSIRPQPSFNRLDSTRGVHVPSTRPGVTLLSLVGYV